ncbi:MAG: hypothetical protein IBJ03_04020 [Gemmatimonadaceae bacterium]|nr:hypothetical protein [Gemmatimonadaceae bacterium]
MSRVALQSAVLATMAFGVSGMAIAQGRTPKPSPVVALEPALVPSDSYEPLQPTSMRPLGNGGLVFADVKPVTLRVVDSKSRSTRVLANAGAGPSEYKTAPELLSFPGDSIAAWDASLRRWSLLAPNGSYVRLLREHETGTTRDQRAVRVYDGALVYAASLRAGSTPSAVAIARIVKSSEAMQRGLIIRQSAAGQLWVAPAFAATHWAVFDSTGSPIGQHQFGEPLRVTWADARTVLGVTLDTDSLAHIVRGRLPAQRASASRPTATLVESARPISREVQQRLSRVLRGLIGPQEKVYSDKGQYTTNYADLKRPASTTEFVRFIDATNRGWLAMAIDAETGATCAMGVGLTPTAWNEAEPYCSAAPTAAPATGRSQN